MPRRMINETPRTMQRHNFFKGNPSISLIGLLFLALCCQAFLHVKYFLIRNFGYSPDTHLFDELMVLQIFCLSKFCWSSQQEKLGPFAYLQKEPNMDFSINIRAICYCWAHPWTNQSLKRFSTTYKANGKYGFFSRFSLYQRLTETIILCIN